MRRSATRSTVAAAGFTALIAAGSYISIPIGPVPIVLQSFFILLAGLLLPARTALSAVAIYLLLGALGLPVFAGGTGGIGHFFGPTGGYLLSYLPAVVLVPLLAGRLPRPALRVIAALCAGTVCIYLIGIVWLKWNTGMQWYAALSAGVLPFLPGDGLKIAAALLVSRQFAGRIEQFLADE